MFEEFRSVSSGKRTFLRTIVQVVVIALFVLAIVYFMRKYSADISALKQLNWLDIIIIGACSFVSYSAYAYAVYIVLVDVGLKDLGPFAWLRIYFVSRMVNFFVIQGGNLYRLILLKKKYHFSYSNTVGVTGFLIWINVLIAIVASGYVLADAGQDFAIGEQNLLYWWLLIVVALATMPLIFIYAARLIQASNIPQSRVVVPFLNIADFFVGTLGNVRLLATVSMLSVVHFCFFVAVNYFTFRAIGQAISVELVCIFTTAFVFTRYVNVVPGNIGVSELVSGLVSERMGLGFGNGLLVSGIVRMVEVLMILLTGLIYGKYVALSFFRQR